MQRQRGELVPIGEAFSGLDAGPLQAIRDATPQARHHFTQADPPAERASGSTTKPNPKTRIASAKGRVKPLARLLRCATALRVTAPLGYGSSSGVALIRLSGMRRHTRVHG